MRRVLLVPVAGVLAAGLLLGAAVGLAPRQSGEGGQAPGAALATVAAFDRAPAGSLPQAIGGLERHLREQPRDAAAWAALGVAYVERARIAADPADYGRAEAVLGRSLSLAPEDNDAGLAGQAALAAARHDFTAALALADRALAVNPYGTRGHAARIDALVELGRYGEALAAARRADAARPAIPVFTRYAYVLELLGRPGDAARVLDRALVSATDPGDVAYVATQLGDLAWSGGDLRGAGAHYDAALRADHSFAPALDGRARVLAARGDRAGALRLRQELVGRLPLPAYLVALGELYEAGGRPDEAGGQYALVAAWTRLAEANGVVTDLETALVAADHGEPAAALASALAEHRRRPGSVHTADALAWALHAAGRDREALGYARQATRTGYRNPLLLYHRGMIERALGLRAEARRSLAAALGSNPRFSPLLAPRARAALAELGGMS